MPETAGVSGLIIRDGRILLVRRAKAPFKGYWSLPGGRVESGETPEEAVTREVREETGLDVAVGRVAGRSPQGVVAYSADILGGELCAGDDASACEFLRPVAVLQRRTTPGLVELLREAGVIG